MDLSQLLSILMGNTTGPSTPVYPPGVSLNRPQGGQVPNGLAPPQVVGQRTDLPVLPPAHPVPVVPGNQRIPVPTARPTGMENTIAGVSALSGYGPSVSPSQEGVMASPSQGPGEAVTQPDPVSRMPGIMEAIQRMTEGNSAPAAPRAPAPPAPNRMAPGQLPALIGGQNPLAPQQTPVIAMLSRLLGGR